MNTITFELGPESQELLKAVLAALVRIVPVEAELVVARTAETPTVDLPEAAPFDQGQRVTVSRTEVQKKVVELSAAGKKSEVRAIVTKYAPKVSAIADADLATVWQELEALNG